MLNLFLCLFLQWKRYKTVIQYFKFENLALRTMSSLCNSISNIKVFFSLFIKEKTVVTYHSIITDVFNGKLKSSVQCLACNRVRQF